MALLNPLQKVATKLIKQFGRDVIHVTVTDAEYNEDTGDSSTETEAVIRAVISAYKSSQYNDVILVGDAPLITTSKVKIDDDIIIDSKRYRVIQPLEAIPIEDGIVMYQCNLRGI